MRDLFLEGMSQAACTVSIVTTDGPQGRAGVTVSAMTSVSADTPTPSLLVCVHHKSAAATAIRENGVFCVNVLRDDQAFISDTFAGRIKMPGGDKFECADWETRVTGAPVLTHPLVAFDCHLRNHFQWGSHFIFIGELADIDVHGTGSPLIYANRAYGTPAPLPPVPASPGGDRTARRESLGVGCFVTLGPYFMPQLLARVLTDRPDLNIELFEGNQERLLRGLETDEFAVALTYDLELGPGVETEPLGEAGPHVLLPQGHPLARESAVSLRQLAEEPMVLLDIPPSRQYFTSLFADAGYEANIRFRSPSFEMVRGMVGHGLGYSLLVTKPANNMTYDGRALAVRPLSDQAAPSRIVAARRAGAAPSPLVRVFTGHCRSFFAAQQAA